MSLRSRIDSLEKKPRPCPACGGAPTLRTWFDPGDGTAPPPEPTCPTCGRVGLLVCFHVTEPAPEAQEDEP